LLKHKTRILVTHAVDFLHLADRIVIMKDGMIQAQGTMAELEENPHLKQVMETHRKNQNKT
jgi:ABC-type bacteriocin/lantibiotic exporter with double-glycine peptidase domain